LNREATSYSHDHLLLLYSPRRLSIFSCSEPILPPDPYFKSRQTLSQHERRGWFDLLHVRRYERHALHQLP